MKKILLLGSTGSIGKSTENTIRRYKDRFELVGISVNRRIDDAIAQIVEFPTITHLSVGTPDAAAQFPQKEMAQITLLEGTEGLEQMANDLDYDILVNALVGSVGFGSTVAALKRGKTVALANKESLVVGGDLVTKLLKSHGGTLLPIDSEHSAILQCLTGEDAKTLETMTITASGGPFRTLPRDQFKNITRASALKPPTWAMAPKITIDSSTWMNKGFEIIEAHHIFQVPFEQINVVVHPQSIIHSMVTFTDGATMAQCGLPDMELPIQYALTYPERLAIPDAPRLDLAQLGELTFFEPDFEKFPCLNLCIEAGKAGGTVPAVLNAANEIAVESFLNETLPYTDIAELVQWATSNHSREECDSVEQIIALDIETRAKAREWVKGRQ